MDVRDAEVLFRAVESDRLERKARARDLSAIRRAVVALANDLSGAQRPGHLIIGQNNDLSCAALAIDDRLLQTLANVRADGAVQPFPSLSVDRFAVEGCDVVILTVQPSENPPVRVDGRTYVRVGPTTRVATAEEERRLVEKRRWGALPFDARGVQGASLNDIDMARFEVEYVRAAVAPSVLSQNERTVEEQMAALRLVDQGGLPTVTAVLILGKDPTTWLPGAYLQALRLDGTALTDSIINQRELRGSLVDQIRQVDELIDLWIERPVLVGGSRREERPTYSGVALRQLIRNAYLHRLYEATNAPVRLTWYSDRIEILSPGGPFGQVNEENFGKAGITDYRNPTLGEALKNLGFLERFGLGIQIARKELSMNGNPPPEFIVDATSVLSIIRLQS